MRYLPSITAMQCFEASARHLSFTRAADELSLTQSAVSKQVAQLESFLNRKLFRRVRRSLCLTPEGAIYIGEVRKILAQLEMSSQYIMSYNNQRDVLRVATLPTFGSRWLAPRLSAFLDRYTHISLDCSEKVESFDLEQEGIDIAFFYGHGSWPGLECHRLFGEEVIPVCAPELLNNHSPTSPLELTRYRLLHLSTRPRCWHDWFAAQDLTTEHSYQGNRFETFHMLLRATMAGCGIALLPRFLIEDELASGQLVVPWSHCLTSANSYYLVYPERLGEGEKVRLFADYLLGHSAAGMTEPTPS
ncbi:transcriptional regulator GcvA [Oceanimonas sp. CAM02]|uniref:transcriptional regulator GcvA n=1 Tax=Oceanimonas sp. CAM02 TaxID=3080336 RepID=UPI002936C3C1|nr:transcriptional regulator GcvA [Oceanimonas sp. CAM02]MDV2856975.1 transcriptional regulator GcvA [Oceanimonas sp. CAM02]